MKAIIIKDNAGGIATPIVAKGLFRVSADADAMVTSVNETFTATTVVVPAGAFAGLTDGAVLQLGVVDCDSTVVVGDTMVFTGVYTKAP